MCVCVCVCELPTHHYSWTTVSLHKINVMKPPEECRLQSQKNDREEGDRTGERGVVRENKGGRGRQGEEEG